MASHRSCRITCPIAHKLLRLAEFREMILTFSEKSVRNASPPHARRGFFASERQRHPP